MTGEIAMTLSVLAVTILLFVTEFLRVDVAAIVVMLLLPWLGLIEPSEAFMGFSSNAVIAMIGVMVLGYAIDASGAMRRLVGPVSRAASGSERRLTAIVSASVGMVSAFMQNIGATVLFLPAVKRIAGRSGFSTSRILMPLGFAAILGGTLTMIASGPLIILNDLMRQSGDSTFGIFSVTPVGIVLLAAGVFYFLLFGKRLMPKPTLRTEGEDDLVAAWDLPSKLTVVTIPQSSPISGRTIEEADLWGRFGLHILAEETEGKTGFAPWRGTVLTPGVKYALSGDREGLDRLLSDGLVETGHVKCSLDGLMDSDESGFAELVVRPRSGIEGRTIRQLAFRKTWGVEPLLLCSGGRTLREDISDIPLRGGDTLVVHGPWQAVAAMGHGEFLPAGGVREARSLKGRPILAGAIFAAGIALAVAGFQLSLALMSAVAGMILFRVITVDEAYRAVEWRTVFLLAGLIPLGRAMETTGTAAYLADGLMGVLGGAHPMIMMTGIALLATVFTLFMSNVAATVLLVPLVMTMAPGLGIAPRALAILVAICASNSFVLPTHQVNALLMAPGGYCNRDYMRAGGPLTLLFIALAVPLVYFIFR